MPHTYSDVASEENQALHSDVASLQALYRVTSAIIQRGELADLLQTVVDSIAQALPAERVVLITFDTAQCEVLHFVKGGTGTGSVVTVSYDELQHGLSGWVLQERKPALSLRATPDPRELPDVQKRRVATECGDIIVVPLMSGNHVLGTLTAINHFNGAEFGAAQVAMMRRMADHAAVAISASEYHEQLEDEILRRQALEQSLSVARDQALDASRLKSEFLANISHEIRTPMNAVLGMVALLQQTGLSDRQRDYTDKAESAARSLLALLNDVLDFSKIEANKMQLDIQPLSLDAVLRNLSVLLASAVEEKSIEVLFDLDPALPSWFLGDAMRLQQVLLNLCSNAIKFTHTGHVILAVNLLAANSTGHTIEFSVADTGIGIAPDQHAAIFNAFSQAEGATTRKYGGTGLGLTICKRFVEMMGAELRLASTVGAGSTFSFTLTFPVAGRPVDAAPQPPLEIPAMKVLIVERGPLASAALGRMLSLPGWHAEVASDGEQAADAYRQACATNAPFTGVILNSALPDADSWTLAHKLHRWAQDANTSPPAIVMLTSLGRQRSTDHNQIPLQSAPRLLVRPPTASMLLEALQPSQSVTAPTPNLLHAGGAPLRDLKILVVEDNAINQQVAKELLRAKGALVTLANNGQIAVDLLAKDVSAFDVVLMDLQMPVLDGFGAAREIRETLGLHLLPIIAMTANAMASDRQACMEAGMNEHVSKPFNIDTLVTRILQFAQGAEKPTSAPGQQPQPLDTSPSLDVVSAIARMAGMTALYVDSARQFLADLSSCGAEIQGYLNAGHTEPLQRLLHTLKGNAATLGATGLAAQFADLESLMKSNSDHPLDPTRWEALDTLVALTRAQLAEAIEQLEATPSDAVLPASPPPPILDLEQAIRLLGDIAKLADAGDAQLHQLVERNLEFLESADRQHCDALTTALQKGAMSTVSDVSRRMMNHVILTSLAA